MKKLILFLMFTFISCGSDKIQLNQNTQNIDYLKSTEQKMLLLVNEHRISKGLVPFQPLFEAAEQSQGHSHYMAYTLRRLTHNGFKQRINNIKSNSKQQIVKSGENIAYNSSTLRAHKALLNSRGHRKNIEGDFTHVGVGEVTDSNGRMYFTQIFVKIIN